MGRFGDVLLVNGEAELSLTAQRGEVVRLYLTNTANTRVFKVALPGARMKLVGGDSGHVEHEELVDDVMLAPSERVVVDVLFDQAGELRLGAPHARPGVSAGGDQGERRPRPSRHSRSSSRSCVPTPRWPPSASASRPTSTPRPTRRSPSWPRWTWARRRATAVVYTCPMHPEVVSEEAGHCPKCGMKLLPAQPRSPRPEAAARAPRAPRPRARSRHRRWDRVGGRHGRRQPDDHAGEHALEARSTARPAPRTPRSTGRSRSATGSRSAC